MSPTLRHRLVNALHSLLLIGGMAGIVWVCAAVLWGKDVAFWTFVAMGAVLVLSPAVPSDVILRLYGARRIGRHDFPEGITILETLCERAELENKPDLFYLPSALPSAFSTGKGRQASIAVSDGMLRLLSRRELAAVLAHEISHILHHDLWIMRLADAMARMTSLISYFGLLLLLLNLPLIMAGAVHVPWIVPLLLAFSPTIISLLQLALSRAREFDADLGAVKLTGDPPGLASALAKLERSTGSFWEEILLPGRRIPEPSLLRTHPGTDDRIARLKALAPDAFPRRPRMPDQPLVTLLPRVSPPPHWRRTGVWY